MYPHVRCTITARLHGSIRWHFPMACRSRTASVAPKITLVEKACLCIAVVFRVHDMMFSVRMVRVMAATSKCASTRLLLCVHVLFNISVCMFMYIHMYTCSICMYIYNICTMYQVITLQDLTLYVSFGNYCTCTYVAYIVLYPYIYTYYACITMSSSLVYVASAFATCITYIHILG